MDEVIITLRDASGGDAWYSRVRIDVVRDLLALGLPDLAVNVCDGAVRHSLLTLTTLDPPVLGFVNVALLRRPDGVAEEHWLARRQVDHTPVAIAKQSTFGCPQNAVARAPTAPAPVIDAMVEESSFPIEATRDLHAFFGAADADLGDRMTRMLASTSAFGADQNIDTVPTSCYVFRSPFTGEARP